MTKIEQKAKEYAKKNKKVDWKGFDIDADSLIKGYIAGATEIMNEMKCCGNCESPSSSCEGCKDLSNWSF